MAATYCGCTSSKGKYSTVTAAAPCFCAQRWAAASIALWVGSTYVLRIHSRRMVPFCTAGAATAGRAKAAEAPTAPARKLRRVRRASRMEAPPVFAALRSGGASAAEYRARGGPCQGRLASPHHAGQPEREPGERDQDAVTRVALRSEEHTSELQSPYDLVCRLLLEKKKEMKRS